MLKLSDVRTSIRIALACLLPVLAFVAFASYLACEEYRNISRGEQILGQGRAA